MNKKIISYLFLAACMLCFQSIYAGEGQTVTAEKTYTYETVENDPLNARIYTLENGLKVYLTVFKDEPRIQTYIAVKTGSRNDPKETTGLAHYLEHMMFKGTHTIGTKDWSAEQKQLEVISNLFEKHRNETDPAVKTAIYKKIDSVSYLASGYAIANEYDKMVSSLGAKGTNAYTSNDQTVYVNDIPANEIEKWLKLEGERMQTCVLRIFHTELEAVYEEFNRSQDADGRWSYENVMRGLFPNHPYGTQNTIGLGEHLKNPSMVNIMNYYNTYYRPNNIAICLSGDLDPDKTIVMIDKYFGNWKAAPIPEFKVEKQPEISSPIIKEVWGPQEEHVFIGYRFGGSGSDEFPMIKLIDMLMSNSKAGLIDLDLVQDQKVLEAYSMVSDMHDFSMYMMYGRPREGQTLEEVKDLLLGEMEKLKRGEFSEEDMKAVIKDLKLNEMKALESNASRANYFVDAFTNSVDYGKYINRINAMEKITKDELVKFANENYKNNYVISYKRLGESKDRHKVEKPAITAVQIDRNAQSTFLKELMDVKSGSLEPVFIDFSKDIQRTQLKNGIEVAYVHNDLNKTFSLNYILDMGTNHDKVMGLAITYLPYLGTKKMSSSDLQSRFYELGLSFNVSSSADQVMVNLNGLEESLEEGVQLFEDLLKNVVADPDAYQSLVADILKEREDAKLNKNTILNGALMNYGMYGKDNPYRNILSEKELKEMDVNILISKIKSLGSYKHRIFYYGQKDLASVSPILNKYHKVPKTLMDYPAEKTYVQQPTDKNTVYFVHYDMVQAEVMMISKGGNFDKTLAPPAQVFNEYFGSGLSSIFFQEIREKKALAYSAYSAFTSPAKKDEAHYVRAYIGTQADKLKDAIPAVMDLLNNMPEADAQFNGSREAVRKKIQSERITRDNKYWSYERARKRGLDYDLRKDVYAATEKMSLADLKKFYQSNIQNKNYTYLVIGNREKVDMEVLKKLGEVKELSLEEIFNY